MLCLNCYIVITIGYRWYSFFSKEYVHTKCFQYLLMVTLADAGLKSDLERCRGMSFFGGRHSIWWTIFWQAQDTGFVRLSSRLGFITGIPGDNFVWQVRYFGCLRFSFRGKTKTVETSTKKHLKPSRWSIVSYIFNFHVSWCRATWWNSIMRSCNPLVTLWESHGSRCGGVLMFDSRTEMLG